MSFHLRAQDSSGETSAPAAPSTPPSAPATDEPSEYSAEPGKAPADPMNQFPTRQRQSPGLSATATVIPKSKKTAAQRALVQTDGAAAYAQPDFDSPVMDYLGAGTPVIISKTRVKGKGGFGSFYKIKLKGKGVGYIADVDVVPSLRKAKGNDKKMVSNPEFQEMDDQRRNPQREPLFFTRYLGGALGMVNYSERFSGRTLSSSTLMYGLKMTGPGVLFDGPPLDFSFMFSAAAPDYYGDFAKSASGFFLFGDIIPLFPLMEWREGLMHFGLGVMWTYTNFDLKVKNSSFDSQEFRAGAVLPLAASWRIKRKYVVRAEAKYYWEKTKYLGYWISFQVPY